MIKAVHEYQDLLRASVATAGNDHRLGANEAPPAIVSMFLGDELTGILEAITNGGHYEHKAVKQMEIGVTALPHIPKDITDRNRTSPFAFTGNKFEFRMPGASLPIAEPCTVLNTAVAEALRQLADTLESAEDFQSELASVIKETFQKHKNIVYNNNSYSETWPKEAERRGLLNLKTYVDALPVLISPRIPNCSLGTRSSPKRKSTHALKSFWSATARTCRSKLPPWPTWCARRSSQAVLGIRTS